MSGFEWILSLHVAVFVLYECLHVNYTLHLFLSRQSVSVCVFMRLLYFVCFCVEVVVK